MKRTCTLLGLVVAVVIGLFWSSSAHAAPSAAAPSARTTVTPAVSVFDVRSYGATGDGSTDDSPAVNKAITAANSAGGGIVEFPSGNYKSKHTIHMKSNVTLQLDAGSTVLGSSADTYDAAEPNPYDAYQDYGHSHFHDAMIYGDGLTNIGFTGSGTIDGAGNLITGNPGSGQADKIISLTHCKNLTLSGITLRRGGHFGALINGCDHVTSDHLTIDTASDRDGWNVISTTNATITNAHIAANDDALVFKSDYALGAKLPNGHVTVTGSTLSAQCCNALMFGSETCGDFTDYQFQGITITGASKSGLGMVTMDGANISDVHYRDITMTGVHSPIMQKIGTRKRCGNSPGTGHISGITYDNISATGVSPSFTPTIWGESGGNHITDETFTNVNITVPGGSSAISTSVPSNNATDYNPSSIGTRPAYGWYIHNADNLRFSGSGVKFASNDDRPAVIANTGSDLVFDHFTVQRGSASAYDLGFQSVTGYCVTGSVTTTGSAPRVNSSSSTQHCPTPSTRYEAEDAAYSAGSTVDANHLNYSGSGFVNTDNAAGAYVEFTVNSAAAGSYPVTLRYANGTTTDRPADVIVNGTTVAAAHSFAGTGSWDAWADATLTVPLQAGANTIRVAATTANGDANLDYLDGPA
ncbi:glycosyl hydrolase family 28 protein [Streptomyces cocklensis]|uniref:Carbohydrate binding family 6 n=1 Tax=Actinacidiphila cocklensis TaxID=887465 RepID=A0A9W4DL21_9ACTN|nr:glycosyl hydrolase family 28 protein [Actinacidiphila cocklensis]MDD1062651.1 glycosyl hydrolase family 28 protein [Actinacidiphila cocklensis]CAG6392139.1 Carbohydrate binding family 6 [Actinacidiphila cocklensis]